MGEAGYASEHDQKVARWAAYILAGGRVTPGTLVTEQYLLDLEREAFSPSAASAKPRSASPSPSKPASRCGTSRQPTHKTPCPILATLFCRKGGKPRKMDLPFPELQQEAQHVSKAVV